MAMSFNLLVSYILFFIPFDVGALLRFNPYFAHLCPFLLHVPLFYNDHAVNQGKKGKWWGLTFFILYAIWLGVFDALDLTCEGETYIYKVITYRKGFVRDLITLAICIVVIEFYHLMYKVTGKLLDRRAPSKQAVSPIEVSSQPAAEDQKENPGSSGLP